MKKKSTSYDELYCIGIDGGGSRTRGVLVRGEEVLANKETGTARVGTVGVVESAERLLNLMSDICAGAGVALADVEAVSIGLAGVWLQEEQQRSRQLIKLLAKEKKVEFDYLHVTSDAAIALEGAHSGKEGIVLIVGTGTIAIGKTESGDIVRCGGWGIDFSDEGSGAWIGKEGLAAYFRYVDGRGQATAFTDAFFTQYSTLRPEEPRSIIASYNERAFDFAALAPLVMQCAEQGDAVCQHIVERAADALIDSAEALANKHFSGKKTHDVACIGGIAEADTPISRALTQRFEQHPTLQRIEPIGSPLDGALALARSLVALDLSKE